MRGDITPEKRAIKNEHKSALVIIAGDLNTGKVNIAKALEEILFAMGKSVYFLGISNELLSAGAAPASMPARAKIEQTRAWAYWR